MKNKLHSSLIVLAVLALSTLNSEFSTAHAQGTAFTYQGQLQNNGSPASGSYDFRFRLAADAQGNTYVGSPVLTNALAVSGGLFTVTLDFGSAFAGSNYWLEVDVRTNGAGGYAELNPLQSITPAPYSVFAATAEDLSGSVSSANLSAAFSGPVTLTNSANVFSGDGAGLTALHASHLATGTVPDAQLGGNVARTNQVWLLGGNAGTVPGANFLGTTDNQPLEIRVNGARALRLEPNTNGAPNIVGGAAVNFVSSGTLGATIAGGGAIYDTYSDSHEPETNQVTASFGTVSGGGDNSASGFSATVSGGGDNSASGFSATVSGGLENTASGGDATVSGGDYNTASGDNATVSGGEQNSASNYSATVSGGDYNTASDEYATVSGGDDNRASGFSATVSGGDYNTASDDEATVSGGIYNNASDEYATVSGGYANNASGFSATVSGGQHNIASGDLSFAAGSFAEATNDGTFVWADNSSDQTFSSTAENQFLIRASGGVGIGMNAPQGLLHVQGTRTGDFRSSIMFAENLSTAANAAPALRVVGWGDCPNGVLNVSGNGTGLIARFGNDSTFVAEIENNGTIDAVAFSQTSDRNAKENFNQVDPMAVLEKVTALPISEWNFKAVGGIRHIGPMAQDFQAAFHVGQDDKHIATVDADGVALAAIQGLNQKLEETRQAVKAKNGEIQSLKQQNDLLATRMNELEATVRELAARK